MKNHGSWHRADQAEWEWDSRPNALFQAAGRRIQAFQTVCVLLAEESANGLRFN
jgi:hypothetical protein